MSFKVEISTTVDENEWNHSLNKNSSSMIYQTTKWQELYQTVYDSEPIFVTVRDESKTIVGQLACLIHKEVFWQHANTISRILGKKLKLGTVLWWYHGPIIHDDVNKTQILEIILNAIDEIVVKNNVVMIRGISSPLEQQDFDQNFVKFGYKIEPRLTFVIDLTQDINELYNSLKKDTRYYIRKSEKEDFEFSIATEKNVFDKFQELKHHTKKSDNKKIFKISKLFDMHWEILKNSGFENLLVAKKNSKIEGIILTLNFNGNLIQHALANSPKFDFSFWPKPQSSSTARDVSLRVESVLLPGRNLATLDDTNIYGPTREIVNGVSYADEIKISFQASSDLGERRFFEEWQKLAFSEKTWNVGYYNDYIAQIDLYLLDREDNRRFGVKLWECFPKTIDGTELNQGANNEIIKNDVSFSFRYWTQLDINAQAPTLTDRLVTTFFGSVERQITGSIPKILNRL